jgi:hypothetical protein
MGSRTLVIYQGFVDLDFDDDGLKQGCQTKLKTKNPFWVNFGGSCIGRCWYVHGHLVYFMAIWYSLWPFGIFYGYLVYFSPFWYVVPRKIWQPWGRKFSA